MYDVNDIRKLFPMLNGKTMQNKPLVFLDNSSTTFKPQCVIDAINNYYLNMNANSHRGDYDLCYNVDEYVYEARKTVANFINCNPNEVIFTSGDTMSLNMIAWGIGIRKLKKGDEILISIEEHASNAIPWFKVAEMTGAVLKYIPLNENGEITAENVLKTISKKTKIVSVAQISNVLGYLCDVKEIGKITHQFGAYMVVDGAQSVPHIKVDFKDLDIDFLTFSGHKMCGPTGIGCLIGKEELLNDMDPMLTGGGMNVEFYPSGKVDYLKAPSKFESGTLPLAEIFGLKAAIEFLESIGMNNIHEHDVELFDYAVSKLKDNDKITIYNKNSRNGILTFHLNGVFSQDEATFLNYKGIAVRSGKHCAKMLNDFLNVPATCRMSTYLYTSKEEIDYFIDSLLNGGDILDAYFN